MNGAAATDRPGLDPRSSPSAEERRPRREILRSKAKDLLLATDPGFHRLIQALLLVGSIAVTIGVLYAFEHVTHTLWIEAPAGGPPAAAAELALQHQEITLLAMLIGGIVAMLASFAVMDTEPRQQTLTMALMPVPMLATMALALAVESHHVLGLALLAVVMGLGAYCRKFVPLVGPRAFLFGMMMFIGYFFGFLSRGAIELDQLGSIALILWLAVAVNLVVRLAVANPLASGRLGRTRRSFRARCRAVLDATVTTLEAGSDRQRRKASDQLHRRLGRLNETALIIDALIAEQEAGDRGSPGRAHEELFEFELIVQNIARAGERLAWAGLPPRLDSEVRGWLTALRGGHGKRAATAALAFGEVDAREFDGLADEDLNRLHYLAEAVVELATLNRRLESGPPIEEEVTFESPVSLIFGQLPGSSLVGKQTAEAPAGRGGALLARLRIDPAAQVAIRVTLAVGVASAIGSIVSERRFYWAVLAVFITFMGTNTSAEQLNKAFSRVAGTVVGIAVGSVLAHAIGLSAWSIPVILVALGIGVYFMKVNYAVMVIGITVMVAQLYEQLGEYSDQLLLLRLAETSIGAVVAMAAALLIFPVGTRRTAATAARGYLDSLADLLGRSAARLSGEGDPTRLSVASRALDSATQQLTAAARPLRRTTFRRDRLEHNLGLFTHIAHITRNLVTMVEGEPAIDPEVAGRVAGVVGAERRRVEELSASLADAPAEAGASGEARAGATGDRRAPADAIPPGPRERRLLQNVDRLDEAIAELGENLASHAPA